MSELLSFCLIKYRITPQSTTGLSPAQLLMGRRLRTHLDLLHPDISKVQDKQQKEVSGKAPRTFKVGDKLFAKNFHGTKWIPVVVSKVTGPLSYHVNTSDGLTLRRHVDHLRIRHSENSEHLETPEESDDEIWISNQPESATSSALLESSIPSQTSSTAASTVTANGTHHSTRTRAPIDRYSPSR